jgi:hypothetical protein
MILHQQLLSLIYDILSVMVTNADMIPLYMKNPATNEDCYSHFHRKIYNCHNIKLQHPVALHRSDFAFCFYTVYVQCLLLFSRCFLFIDTMCFSLTYNKLLSQQEHSRQPQTANQQNHKANVCSSRTPR